MTDGEFAKKVQDCLKDTDSKSLARLVGNLVCDLSHFLEIESLDPEDRDKLIYRTKINVTGMEAIVRKGDIENEIIMIDISTGDRIL